MFEIGWSELLLIAVVAIIVIGPKELPGVLRGLGRTLNKLRRSADDFRRQFEDSVRETGFEDIQRDLRSVSDMNPATQIRNSINDAFRPPASTQASTSHLSPSAFDAQLDATPAVPASEPASESAAVPTPAVAAPDIASNEAAPPTEEKPELPRAHAASA